jgi:anaerobic dimethyl sulfoxide reductase subunit B (iron-sulfur subunit)
MREIARRSRIGAPGKPGFKLDLGRCVGCGACVLACRMENALPADVSWRTIIPVNEARVGSGPTFHLSVACHHCENPPCTGACPTGALEKRPDGIVLLNTDRCIGCRYCEMACPFGAPAFDAKAGLMTKCHFCHHRLAEGLDPACVAACPTHALRYAPPEPVMGVKEEDSGGLEHPEGGDSTGGRGGSGDEVGWVPAFETPGFSDPAGARPGFWVAEPGGVLRSTWYRRLRSLLGLGQEESDDRW